MDRKILIILPVSILLLSCGRDAGGQAHRTGGGASHAEQSPPAIDALYPSRTRAGQVFNLQPDGSAALAIGCRNATNSSVILWEGRRLDTAFGNANLISAKVPDELFAHRGRYRIEILDPATTLKSAPVYFEVR